MLFHGVLGGLVVFTQFAVVHSQMAPAYHVDGADHSNSDGTYYRMATAQCNGKPVYQLGGSDGGDVLFQPEGHSNWMLDTSDHATSCDFSGYIESSGNGGSCAASPDGGGCSGKWQEGCDDDWCNRPELSVTNPQCDGIHCGAHGDCAGGVCVCEPAYSGAHCENYGACDHRGASCKRAVAHGVVAYTVHTHVARIRTDPCALVNCGSHGSCSGGQCTCESRAYSGDRCQNFGERAGHCRHCVPPS